MMNTSSFDHSFLLSSDYEMDDMEYSPSPSASPLVMHPDINIMSSPPKPNRTNNCCGHDPYFNIMEICQFCNNEICSSCRIKSISSQNESLSSENHKINKSHDIDQYDPYSYSQSPNDLQIEKYQCKACTIKKEEESMTNIIASALNKGKLIDSVDQNKNEVHIISIIAQFTVGHIIKCCDSSRNCTNDISISNRFDFESECIDSDNNKITNTMNTSYDQNNNPSECEHASIQYESDMNMISWNSPKINHFPQIHLQHAPNISHSNYHRHAMNMEHNKSPPTPKKQNKQHQIEDITIINPEPKQINSNYVDIYGQRRTVFCNDCHNAKRSTTTPFMMLMSTKRFQKNQFGVYE